MILTEPNGLGKMPAEQSPVLARRQGCRIPVIIRITLNSILTVVFAHKSWRS